MKRIDKTLPFPKPAYHDDAAIDLHSRINCRIRARGFQGVPTGVAIELEPGYEAQIRPRSGLALKQGIGILNSPGTIDTGYRGEIVAILMNFSDSEFVIEKGDRVCQIAIRPVPNVELEEVEELSGSERSSRGFGSSGKD